MCSSNLTPKRKRLDPEEDNTCSSYEDEMLKRVCDHTQVAFKVPKSPQISQDDNTQEFNISQDLSEANSQNDTSVIIRRSSSTNFYDKDEESLQMRVTKHIQSAPTTNALKLLGRGRETFEWTMALEFIIIMSMKDAGGSFESEQGQANTSRSAPADREGNNSHNTVDVNFKNLFKDLQGPHQANQNLSFLHLNSNEFEEVLLNRVNRHIKNATAAEKEDDEEEMREGRDHNIVLHNTVHEVSSSSKNGSSEGRLNEHEMCSDLLDDEISRINSDIIRDINERAQQVQNLLVPPRSEDSKDGEVSDASSQPIFFISNEAEAFENGLLGQLCSPPQSQHNSSGSNKSSEALSTSTSQDKNGDSEENEEIIIENKEESEESEEMENSSSAASCENSAIGLAMEWNRVKLFEGSDLTVNEGILNVMDLWISNKESKAALDRTLKAISRLLPKNNNLPSSAHTVLSFIEGLAPDLSVSKHYFCKACGMYSEHDDPCSICVTDNEAIENSSPENGHFFIFDIGCILKYWFEERNLEKLMHECRGNNNYGDGTYSDIQDGTIYKSVNRNSSRHDVNLVLGIDGVSIRKGSCKECWIVMAVPVEVPIHLRASFTTVVGIWYDKVKPKNMNAFLKPFCEKIKAINEDQGLCWKHPDTGETHKSQIEVPLVVADAPARAKVQNLMNFNSINGCNICEIATVRCAPQPGKKRIRYYRYRHNLTLRNKETMHHQAVQATDTGKPVKGVKGPSILSILPNFDISTCCFPEYMHSVLLGSCKQIIKIFIEQTGPFKLKDRIPAIDKILTNIQHPDFIHRIGRTFKHLSAWKASDYYYFLLYEALPVLQEFLPEMYFQHLILLVRSIFHLLKRKVSESDIIEADLLLRLFVQEFQTLYGDRAMSYNVHQLCHLALSVKRFGPLHCNSAFPFENMNGIIAKATHGTNFVSQEIVNNIRIYQGVQRLERISKGLDSNITQFSQFCSGEVLGRCREVEVNHEEMELLGTSSVKVYSRAKLGFDVYTSEIHKKLKTANYYVMWKHKEANLYGSVRYFLERENVFSVCVRMLKIDHVNVIYHHETLKSVTHLIPFQISDEVILINDQQILSTFVKVGKVKNFLYVRPNTLRSVL
ncbi:DNA polymerase IV [Frankliniella fusca]|uniref:DNA polymerase IV n=1 Tax=Frankliniella fusca TaxID=407009 RepID=A0AAE1HNE3_9NEOP|nr:DNA polymerase IV [Frankliniella fusca]